LHPPYKSLYGERNLLIPQLNRYIFNIMITVSETKHVLVFMFKQLLNINKEKPRRFSLYPKVGRVPESFTLLLSFGFVIPNDLVDVAIQSRCRTAYIVYIDDLLAVVVRAGTVSHPEISQFQDVNRENN
jgi:hypothetical protein